MIRDDGVTVSRAPGYDGLPAFLDGVAAAASRYSRHRGDDEPHVLEVWVEAAGMVPQVARVAHPYGADVYSSSGFDSLTAKHDAAQRMIRRDRPTVVLNVGDHDPSGLSIFDSASADVGAMVDDLGGLSPLFTRAAVAPEQIDLYRLPTAPSQAH